MSQSKEKLLYLIRAEGDFERVVSLAIAGKGRFVQSFIFVGDFHPIFEYGIENKFQKKLFAQHGFRVLNLTDFSLLGKILEKFSSKEKSASLDREIKEKKIWRALKVLFLYVLKGYLQYRKKALASKVIIRLKPDRLFTDQSMSGKDYLPEIFRSVAKKFNIPSFLFTHGAGGALHQPFHDVKVEPYDGYHVFSCNKYENNGYKNRTIIGDMVSSYPYENYLASLDLEEIKFYDDRKYRIAFIQSGIATAFTLTNAWSVMEEIIINHSNREDIAIVVKTHPRERQNIDERIIGRFNNTRIVGAECDRSRVVKWANVVVCSDHCSAIFSPMIQGKVVVCISGLSIPKYQSRHSPVKGSSVNHISSAKEFDLCQFNESRPNDPIIDEFCWGGHGHIDLAKLTLSNEVLSGRIIES